MNSWLYASASNMRSAMRRRWQNWSSRSATGTRKSTTVPSTPSGSASNPPAARRRFAGASSSKNASRFILNPKSPENGWSASQSGTAGRWVSFSTAAGKMLGE